MNFTDKLSAAWSKNDSLVCVGLDPDVTKMPDRFSSQAQPLYDFNKAIIDATADYVCAYKPNTAFYEAWGAEGVAQLKSTTDYLHEHYPELPIIIDAKRADIDNTNIGSVKYIFDYLGADAVTLNPYMGRESLQPFLDLSDKGMFILCHTSNQGADELQELLVDGHPLYQHVAKQIAGTWNVKKNCCLVVGATYPEELRSVREIVGDDMVLLMPGIGAQGGDLERALAATLNHEGNGIVVSTSRNVLYASRGEDFADAARIAANQQREAINQSKKDGVHES